MIIFGIIGLILITFAVWVRNEKNQDWIFVLGGLSLLIYSWSIGDVIFIVLQIIFTISVLFELVKIRKKTDIAHSPIRANWKVEELRKNKEEKKEKILNLIKIRNDISNNDVEELIGVSDATATRYLQELEDEGKIEQIGEKGRFVKYRLK